MRYPVAFGELRGARHMLLHLIQLVLESLYYRLSKMHRYELLL